ncbi:TPA: hypothetical protein N0F65_011273 [Lagenidium giganteum]|uniref:DDE-1 domain-containing protein n=1 Tax=Lagenidium giganteum TaxID=4803 RepID=A0AAV2YVG2_9STRA|nr:TPA: hypothetical protein N0F65_011273 [Lagenidium giganteum]
MDNVAGHKALEKIDNPDLQDTMDAVIARRNVALEFLPANSPDLCQPANVAVIQKMKHVWRKLWDKEKLRRANEKMLFNKTTKLASGLAR